MWKEIEHIYEGFVQDSILKSQSLRWYLEGKDRRSVRIKLVVVGTVYKLKWSGGWDRI